MHIVYSGANLKITKRSLALAISILLYTLTVHARNPAVNLLYLPSDFPAEVAADYLSLLNQPGKNVWRIAAQEKDVQSGIVLKKADHPSFTTRESFRLQSNGLNLLIISSTSIEGLEFGMYKQLRLAGYKFYLPDALYTIIPASPNIFGAKRDIIDKPFLQIRDFHGTGGLGTTIPDADKSVEKSWILWKLRNGFGAAYQLAGHRGENFVLENKDKLQQHPQWLATPLTGKPNTDQITKLNYLDNDAVNYYVDWSIKPFTQKNYSLPPRSHTDFLSMEPSDAGGYLNELPSNANKKIPSVSDQVFGAANLAAQKLDKLFPDRPNIGVNLYAYSSHAAPPSFKLNPRVFVQLVPYQFQNIAYGPSFIELWASKVKRFGIYDYFKYADAQFDVPGGIPLDDVMKRLIHSVQHGSEGTNYESSFSEFSTGIPLWVMGRYMADGDANWKHNLADLEAGLYEDAHEPIQKLFELFYNNASFDANYMGNAASLVDEASRMTRNAQVQKRIMELKEYLQFSNLVFRSRDLSNGSLKQRMLPVAEYAWKIYETKIVHSYRIMQLVAYAFLNIDRSEKDYAAYQQLHVEWFPETDKTKSAWSKISQNVSSNEIEKDFQDIKKRYPSSSLSQSYSFNDVTKQFGKLKPKKQFVIGGDAVSRGYFGIHADKATEIKINYTLTGNSPHPKLTISGIDNNYTSAQSFIVDASKHELKFSVPAGETTIFINADDGTTYRMEVKCDDGVFYFDGAPRGPMAFYRSLADPVGKYTYEAPFYPSYIFVPKNIQSIEYKVQLNALQFATSSGKNIVSTLTQSINGGFELRKLNVASADAGTIWKATITGNYNYSLANIPDRYFLLEEK